MLKFADLEEVVIEQDQLGVLEVSDDIEEEMFLSEYEDILSELEVEVSFY